MNIIYSSITQRKMMNGWKTVAHIWKALEPGSTEDLACALGAVTAGERPALLGHDWHQQNDHNLNNVNEMQDIRMDNIE